MSLSYLLMNEFYHLSIGTDSLDQYNYEPKRGQAMTSPHKTYDTEFKLEVARLMAAMREHGLVMGRYKVRRLMRQAGLKPVWKRKFVSTTGSKHGSDNRDWSAA